MSSKTKENLLVAAILLFALFIAFVPLGKRAPIQSPEATTAR